MANRFDSGRRATLGAALAVAAAAPLPAQAQWRRRSGERAPLPKSDDERRMLQVLDEVYRNHRYLSVPEEDGRLLRVLAESINAQHVVEIGTSTGYSGLWILLALLKTGGRLTTFEIDPGRHDIARRNFERAGVGKHVVSMLGDAHVEVARLKDSIDLLFLDADKEGYIDYLQKLRALVRPGGLIVAHNMQSPAPDPRYIDAVTTSPELETLFLNMHDAGVGLTLKKR